MTERPIKLYSSFIESCSNWHLILDLSSVYFIFFFFLFVVAPLSSFVPICFSKLSGCLLGNSVFVSSLNQHRWSADSLIFLFDCCVRFALIIHYLYIYRLTCILDAHILSSFIVVDGVHLWFGDKNERHQRKRQHQRESDRDMPMHDCKFSCIDCTHCSVL